jgi:hypothetical protein
MEMRPTVTAFMCAGTLALLAMGFTASAEVPGAFVLASAAFVAIAAAGVAAGVAAHLAARAWGLSLARLCACSAIAFMLAPGAGAATRALF